MASSSSSSSSQQIEQTIDSILEKTKKDILADLDDVRVQSRKALDDALPKLEEEYNKIIADGQKEAVKLERQVIGSADLDVRNKHLLLLEEAVDKVFKKALEQISEAERSNNNKDYADLIKRLIDEAIQILETDKIIIFTNTKDADLVGSMLAEFPQAELSVERIECIGGISARSKDNSMAFENTIDARIQRLKPLIRKEIASKFGMGGRESQDGGDGNNNNS